MLPSLGAAAAVAAAPAAVAMPPMPGMPGMPGMPDMTAVAASLGLNAGLVGGAGGGAGGKQQVAETAVVYRVSKDWSRAAGFPSMHLALHGGGCWRHVILIDPGKSVSTQWLSSSHTLCHCVVVQAPNTPSRLPVMPVVFMLVVCPPQPMSSPSALSSVMLWQQ